MQLTEKQRENEELQAQVKKMQGIIENYRKILGEMMEGKRNLGALTPGREISVNSVSPLRLSIQKQAEGSMLLAPISFSGI